MIEFLRQLIQVKTTAEKGELAAARIIAAELRLSGIDCRIDKWDQDRANITVQVKSSGSKAALLFVGHLDVVGPGEASWRHPPFAAVQSDGKIYGRGSADMKGGIAAIVTAIRQVVDARTQLQGDIIFFGAAGEETDSCGAKRFINNCGTMPKLAGVVVTEPTDFGVVTAHCGLFWLKVTTKGEAAHGSTPELGINAIDSMRCFLNELENYKIPFQPHHLLGKCSMSINTIAGGKEINIVPDNCTVGIDIRTLPAQNHQDIVQDFEKIFARLKQNNSQFAAELSVVRDVEALETDCSCDFIRDFCSVVGTSQTKAVGFTTDGPYFTSLGVPVVIFGPGKSQLCHKSDEYIDIGDIEKAVEHYQNIILRFLL